MGEENKGGFSKLLIDESPLQVLPTLAVKIGLNEAIFIQQVHYWLRTLDKSKSRDSDFGGRRWIYNTLDGWKENFPFWSPSTIRRVISNCESLGVLLSRRPNASGWDQTKFYSIDYERLNDIAGDPLASGLEDDTKDAKKVGSEFFPATGDIVKNPGAARALDAFYKRQSGNGGLDVAHFPEEVQTVVARFCSLWKIDPPEVSNHPKKKGAFADWITDARTLRKTLGEFGLDALDLVYNDWNSDKERLGRVPYTVARPGAIIKATVSKIGELRNSPPTAAITDNDRESARERVKRAKEKVSAGEM